MTSKLTALIEAAKAATPGPWNCEPTGLEKSPFGDTRAWVLDFGNHVYEFHRNDGANAKYIALANPATILELCALLEKAEEALDECDNEFAKRGIGFQNLDDALAAIKQWKETK